MAALDYQHRKRKRGFMHDSLPLVIVAVLCFLVVALNVHA